MALRDDVERVREVLAGSDIAPNGTRAVAVYACGPGGPARGRAPAPAGREHASCSTARRSSSRSSMQGTDERWMVLLANRRAARLFFGPGDALEETDRFVDDVHRQHDQGGWSQAQLPALGREGGRRPPPERRRPRLRRSTSSAAPTACWSARPASCSREFKGKLHPYLKERIAGKISRRRRERVAGRRARGGAGRRSPRTSCAASARRWTGCAQGVGTRRPRRGGHRRGARRAQPGARRDAADRGELPAGGRVDFQAGLLLPEDAEQGEPVEDIVEPAIEKAIEQSATRDGRAPPHRSGAAGRHRGGVAVLRVAVLGTGIMGAPMARNLAARATRSAPGTARARRRRGSARPSPGPPAEAVDGRRGRDHDALRRRRRSRA